MPTSWCWLRRDLTWCGPRRRQASVPKSRYWWLQTRTCGCPVTCGPRLASEGAAAASSTRVVVVRRVLGISRRPMRMRWTPRSTQTSGWRCVCGRCVCASFLHAADGRWRCACAESQRRQGSQCGKCRRPSPPWQQSSAQGCEETQQASLAVLDCTTEKRHHDVTAKTTLMMRRKSKMKTLSQVRNPVWGSHRPRHSQRVPRPSRCLCFSLPHLSLCKMAHRPPIKFAQRSDSLFVTIDLPDVKDAQIKLTADSLSFTCVLPTAACHFAAAICCY